MIGVAIPVHNEEERLRQCLMSVKAAAFHPALQGERVCIVAVLDNCSDGSAGIVQAFPDVVPLACQANNVGLARGLGAAYLLTAGARWLAFTDADTVVSQPWLAAQLSLGAEAVCGTIAVDDWQIFGQEAEMVEHAFMTVYQDKQGHRHVHGANLGLSAHAYQIAGGFRPLACSEDQALVDALLEVGISIAWSNLPRVFTSARKDPRAVGGFGSYLLNIVKRCREADPEQAEGNGQSPAPSPI